MRGISWLILVLLSGTVVKSAAGQRYRIPCSNSRDYCDPENTHLSCLKSKDGQKICECRRGETFDGRECRGHVGQYCEATSKKKCATGAYCDADGYGAGVCQCLPGYIENHELKRCDKIPENPFLQPCDRTIGDVFCKTATTGLKCLKVPTKDEYICNCRAHAIYDKDSLKCRLKMGAVCELKSDSNPNPFQCVSYAQCEVPVSAAPNEPRMTTGVCTEMKPVLEVQSQRKPVYFNRSCNTEDDCNHLQTHLKCVRAKGSHGRICQCGVNSIFLESDQVCYLGVDNFCSLPTYRNPKPQKCLPDRAKCQPDKGSSYSGKCVCIPGRNCHDHSTLPKTLPSVSQLSSSSPSQYSCQINIYLLLVSSLLCFLFRLEKNTRL